MAKVLAVLGGGRGRDGRGGRGGRGGHGGGGGVGWRRSRPKRRLWGIVAATAGR